MRRSVRWLAAMALLLGIQACDEARADVEPMPPLRRPTPEERASLPNVSGRWIFTGFEYPVRDTQRVREQVYRLVPPGEFVITTQRLDSVAGNYVRDSVAFPFTGEVRRDGIFAFVAVEPGGVGQFVSGRVVKDTVWIELTGFPSAASWPPGTRAALVKQPRGAPFVRLRGYVPPPPPPVDSSRPAAPPPAAAPAPAPAPVQVRPQPVAPPPPPPPPPPAPVDTFEALPESIPMPPPAPPPAEPRRRPRRGRDTAQAQPPANPAMPRDTIRIGAP